MSSIDKTSPAPSGAGDGERDGLVVFEMTGGSGGASGTSTTSEPKMKKKAKEKLFG